MNGRFARDFMFFTESESRSDVEILLSNRKSADSAIGMHFTFLACVEGIRVHGRFWALFEMFRIG